MADTESKVNRELDRAVFKGMRHASPHHAELVFETGGKVFELRVNADWKVADGPVLDFALVERSL